MGEAQTVNQFSRSLLLDYRQSHYRPDRLVIAAAGRLQHETLVDLASAGFREFRIDGLPGDRGTVSTSPGFTHFEDDLEQVHVVLGGRAPAAGDKSRFVATLLNLILGGNMSSRLFQEIRENRGLCYSIYSFLHCYSDTGLLGIGAAVGPDNLETLLDTIQAEISRLQRQGVSVAELQAAQDYSRAAFYLGAEDSDNRMMRLAKNEINFGHYISYEEIIQSLEAVTPSQIIAMAQDCLDLDQWRKVSLGPGSDVIPP
jgi:predicted Zn-dependent peptidase